MDDATLRLFVFGAHALAGVMGLLTASRARFGIASGLIGAAALGVLWYTMTFVGQLGTSDGSGVGWYVAASILSFGLLPLATLASALIVGRTLRAALNRMR